MHQCGIANVVTSLERRNDLVVDKVGVFITSRRPGNVSDHPSVVKLNASMLAWRHPRTLIDRTNILGGGCVLLLLLLL